MPEPKRRKLSPSLIDQLEAEGEESDSIETSAAWPRPAPPKLDPSRDAVVFQQIEIEEAADSRGPLLRLFGVTQAGNSVLAHVHGFRPYFYVAAPSGFLNKDLEPLKDTINSAVTSPVPPVISCAVFNRKSLWGYRGNESVPFIRITCADPKALPRVKGETRLGNHLTCRRL
jgi:DNA polymerase delta subunit 1